MISIFISDDWSNFFCMRIKNWNHRNDFLKKPFFTLFKHIFKFIWEQNVYSEYIQKSDVIALDGTYYDKPNNLVIYHN